MNDSRRCTALTAASRYEKRCKKAAIRGGSVCQKHGGGAPQVKRSARERLDSLVEPALVALAANLNRVAKNSNIAVHPSIVRAAVAVLDRAGYKPVSQIELLGLDDAKVTLAKEHGKEIVRVLSSFAIQLGHNPDSEAVRKAGRAALETIGGPFEDASGWFSHTTPTEKKTLLAIMERAEARRIGKAPESGNGKEGARRASFSRPAPPPPEPVEEPDEVVL